MSSQEIDDFIKNAKDYIAEGKHQKHLQQIHHFCGMILIFKQESNVNKFTNSKTRAALNRMLPSATLQVFWREFLDLSETHYQTRCEQGTNPPLDEWKTIWLGENYCDIRLNFIQYFLTKYLNLQRCLPDSGTTNSRDHTNPRFKRKLTNSAEAWNCPVCSMKQELL